VHNATLRAQSGELVAVIGANGAGKSTLLASIAGLLAPDSGTILIDGRAISAFTRVELARLRAYLPQNPRPRSQVASSRARCWHVRWSAIPTS
jgi:iron complex transport system ATP-binding protein